MKSRCLIIVATLLTIIIPFSLLLSQETSKAADTFKEKCAGCHGSKGEGSAGGNIPALKGTSLTVEKIVALITKGDPSMTLHATPIADIKNDEAKAVAKYIKSLK